MNYKHIIITNNNILLNIKYNICKNFEDNIANIVIIYSDNI